MSFTGIDNVFSDYSATILANVLHKKDVSCGTLKVEQNSTQISTQILVQIANFYCVHIYGLLQKRHDK